MVEELIQNTWTVNQIYLTLLLFGSLLCSLLLTALGCLVLPRSHGSLLDVLLAAVAGAIPESAFVASAKR